MTRKMTGKDEVAYLCGQLLGLLSTTTAAALEELAAVEGFKYARCATLFAQCHRQLFSPEGGASEADQTER